MSLIASSTPAPEHNSLQQTLLLMSEAERDIRSCYGQFGKRPVADIDQACKEIGKRIPGIQARLAAAKSDDKAMEAFYALASKLSCLTACVAAAARKSTIAVTPSSPTVSKITANAVHKVLSHKRPSKLKAAGRAKAASQPPTGRAGEKSLPARILSNASSDLKPIIKNPVSKTAGAQLAAKEGVPSIAARRWKKLSLRLAVQEARACAKQLKEFRSSQIAASQEKRKIEIQAFLQKISKLEPAKKGDDPMASLVFATSNEPEQENVLGLLRSMKKIRGGHFGVSGLYNWDIIAQMKSEFAILADYNPNVPLFHRNMLAILAKAKNPEDFVAQAIQQVKKDLETNPGFYARNQLYLDREIGGQDYRDMSRIDQVAYQMELMLKRENGALSKENFPFLQRMAQEGRILPLFLNFNDPNRVKAIADAVHVEGHVFSSIYLSNIYNWGHEDTFQSNVDALKQDGTCVIDTTVKQSFVHYGKDPVTGNAYDANLTKRTPALQKDKT